MTQKRRCAARGDEFCPAGTARAQRVCRQTLFCMNLHRKSHTDNSFANRKEREYENFILQYQTL
jgi:hypothetical protein